MWLVMGQLSLVLREEQVALEQYRNRANICDASL